MPTIISGRDAKFPVYVTSNGQPIPLSGTVSARVFDMEGKQELISITDLDEAADGADWEDGIAVVEFSSSQTGAVPPGDAMLVIDGDFGIKRFRLVVETLFAPTRTSLFIKDIVVDEIRNDRLMAAAAGVLQDIQVSDDYIWDKVRAAESELSHTLRVPLVPTRFFPEHPTQQQIDDLEGLAWDVESSPDYMPDMFERDKWGYIVTRQKPIISVEDIKFVYPTENNGYYDIPLEWLNIDKRYGHIRLVPTSNAVLTSLAGFVMMNIAGGRTIPSMIRITYTAGLTNVFETYPELIDAIKKKAVLKIVADAYFPQSGSISADGLSESISVDLDKYHETIDHIINGPSGSNGGLMAKIHGIRAIVM